MEDLRRILFIDIETVTCEATYDALPSGLQSQWQRKAQYLKGAEAGTPDVERLFREKAGIYAEFAKVVCIGLGCLVEHEPGSWHMLLKALTNADEQALLTQFCQSLDRFTTRIRNLHFCGHNVREFDIPFLSRRMVIHGMTLPDCMNYQGKRPWEVPHIDTMELWSFGDKKHFTSLGLLAEVLGIPTPKDDIDGSMVSPLFWSAQNDQERQENLERIATYCRKDVLTTARIYLRLRGLKDINPEPRFVQD